MIALVVAVLCEALIEYAKSVYYAFENGEKKTAITQLISVVVSIAMCLVTGADIFVVCGITFAYPWIGVVLTGVFASRGANYVSDLIKKLQDVRG